MWDTLFFRSNKYKTTRREEIDINILNLRSSCEELNGSLNPNL